MRNRIALVAVMILSSGLAAAETRADGLIHRLPKDGQWARFETEFMGMKNGRPSQFTATLTISSVGRETVNQKPCRWIEVQLEMKREQLPSTTLTTKLLIPEKAFQEESSPLKHVIRSWSRKGDAKPSQINNPSAAFDGSPFQTLFPGRLSQVRRLDKKVIDSKLGKLACEGQRGQIEIKERGKTATITYETRLHPKAPFGVVSCKLEGVVRRDNDVVQTTFTHVFKLNDLGDGAKSTMPDAK